MTEEQSAAIEAIEGACRQIVLQLMKIHPALPRLGNTAVQDECLKCLHQMTVDLETIKKRLIQMKKDDASTAL